MIEQPLAILPAICQATSPPATHAISAHTDLSRSVSAFTMPYRGFINHEGKYFEDKAANVKAAKLGESPKKVPRPDIIKDPRPATIKDSGPTAEIDAQTKALQIHDRAILDATYSRRKAEEVREFGLMPRKSNVSQMTAATGDEGTPVKEQDGINIEVCSARLLDAFCVVLPGYVTQWLDFWSIR